MAKFFLILAILVATMASVILTMPALPESMKDKPEDEKVVAIPTEVLIQALSEQHNIKIEGEGQSRGNLQTLFNLTAALQGAPTNVPSFTFIPLITLITG